VLLPTKTAPGVADPPGQRRGVRRLHLEVLGAPGVDDLQAVLEVVHEHVRRLPGQRRLDPLAVPGRGDLLHELGVDGVEQGLAGGHQQAGGERVVLGLRHQVGGGEGGDRGVVGQDGDLGGPGLGVDGAPALHEALGGGDVDVAGPVMTSTGALSSVPCASIAIACAPPTA
jgi:hypothetical protein